MKPRTLIFAGLSLLLLWTLTAAAAPGPKTNELKAGKKGEITLTQQTQAGDIKLQPDTYIVQHRASGGDHFVRFVELKQVDSQTIEGNSTYTELDKAGEIKCRMEPATGPITQTIVYTVTENGVSRITKVAIKGEDFVHVL